MRKINLPNILVGTFLGAFIILVGLFGPIIVDNREIYQVGNLIVVDDDGGSDRSAKKMRKRLRKNHQECNFVCRGSLSAQEWLRGRGGLQPALRDCYRGYAENLDHTEFGMLSKARPFKKVSKGSEIGLVIANQQSNEIMSVGDTGDDGGASTIKNNIVVVDAFGVIATRRA